MGKISQNRRVKIFIDAMIADKWALLSVVCLLVIILGALFAFLSPFDPDKTNISIRYQNPSFTHLFGTDNLGRDYFTRALYGARISLLVGVLSMMLSSVIGLTIGTISGYFGGFIDNFFMRMVDIISSIPWMVLVIIISIFIQKGLMAIIIVIGFFSWMTLSRLVRAETLTLKEREYVLYAKASGQSSFKIIVKHILPGIFPLFIVAATIGISGAIMTESTLSFLGHGVSAPNSSWGSMIQSAQTSLTTHPYLALLPGLLIFITIFSLNKVGQVLRIAVEPKTGV